MDDEGWGAARLDLTYYPDQRKYGELLRPRGFVYSLGHVSNRREFGLETVRFRDTTFVSAELKEVVPRFDLGPRRQPVRDALRGSADEVVRSIESNIVVTHGWSIT